MGLYEFIVIVGIALMLFSPRELPKIIKGFARVWGSIRRTADEFKEAILEDEDLRAPVDEIKEAYHGTRQELRQAEETARRELARARMEARMAERKLQDIQKDADDAFKADERVAAGGELAGTGPSADEPDGAAAATAAKVPPPPPATGTPSGSGAAGSSASPGGEPGPGDSVVPPPPKPRGPGATEDVA